MRRVSGNSEQACDTGIYQRDEHGVPILDTVTRPCTVTKTGKNSFRIILTQV